MSLERLLAMIPPPTAGPFEVDWADVEADLGTALPSDYKALVEAYGAALFDDFVTVFVPGHSLEGLNLLDRAVWTLWAAREIRSAWGPEHVPYRLSQGFDGELLPWGTTHNGDACYWVRRSEDPNQWSIAVYESRGPDWYVYDGGLVDFLEGTLSGRVVCDIFVEDYPTAPHQCHQYPAAPTVEAPAPTCADLEAVAGEVLEALKRALPANFGVHTGVELTRGFGVSARMSVSPAHQSAPESLELGFQTVGDPSTGYALELDCAASDQSGGLAFAAIRLPGLPHQKVHRRAMAEAMPEAAGMLLSRVDEMAALVRSLEAGPK